MEVHLPRSGLILSFAKVVTRLAIGLLLINLFVAALAVFSLSQSRLKYEEQAAVATQNLSQLLDHDIAALVRRIDLALLATVSTAEKQLAAGMLQGPALNAFIEQQLIHQPDLEDLRMTDARGFIAYGRELPKRTAASLADQDYFIRLQREADAGMVISKPFLEHASGKWVITLSRRISRNDGSFAGIVYGTVPLDHFTQTFSSLYVGQSGTFTLFDNDLSIVTRQPEPRGVGSSTGMKLTAPELKELLRTGKSQGTFHILSTVDGVERIYSYRKINGVPLNISIGLASGDYLAEWWNEVKKTLAIVSLFMLVTFILSWVIYRAWKRQESAVEALREANRTLDAEKNLKQTIIQSAPLAIYTRDLNGIVTAWNAAAEKMFGWREDEIVGHPMLTVPSEKMDETENIRQRVLSGEGFVQAEVKRQRRDGSLIDINTTLAPLREPSGKITATWRSPPISPRKRPPRNRSSFSLITTP